MSYTFHGTLGLDIVPGTIKKIKNKQNIWNIPRWYKQENSKLKINICNKWSLKLIR